MGKFADKVTREEIEDLKDEIRRVFRTPDGRDTWDMAKARAHFIMFEEWGHTYTNLPSEWLKDIGVPEVVSDVLKYVLIAVPPLAIIGGVAAAVIM